MSAAPQLAMGTLSKRRLEEFGIDVLDRVHQFRRHAAAGLHQLPQKLHVAEIRRKSGPALPWLVLAGVSLGVLAFAIYKTSRTMAGPTTTS
jgi:hypothetical protein